MEVPKSALTLAICNVIVNILESSIEYCLKYIQKLTLQNGIRLWKEGRLLFFDGGGGGRAVVLTLLTEAGSYQSRIKVHFVATFFDNFLIYSLVLFKVLTAFEFVIFQKICQWFPTKNVSINLGC